MEIRLRSVRNESLTTAPSTRSTNRAGTRASSRARRSRALRAEPRSGGASAASGGGRLGVSHGPLLRWRRSARGRASPPGARRRRGRGRGRGRGRSAAGRRVRRRRRGRRCRRRGRCPSRASRDSLDFTSTPAVGLMRTSSRGSEARARAMTTFCALPPDRSETGWSGPSVWMSSRSISSVAKPRLRSVPTKPKRPSRSRTLMVALSPMVMPRTRPCPCRSRGTQPTPALQRGLHVAERQLSRRRVGRVPPVGVCSPAKASASSILPLPLEPASPTTSPRRTVRSTFSYASRGEAAGVEEDGRVVVDVRALHGLFGESRPPPPWPRPGPRAAGRRPGRW